MEIVGHVGSETRGLITFDNGAAVAWWDDQTVIAQPAANSLIPAVRWFEQAEDDPFFESLMDPSAGPTRRMNKAERALFDYLIALADAQ